MKHTIMNISITLILIVFISLSAPLVACSEDNNITSENSIRLLQLLAGQNPAIDFNQISDIADNGRYGMPEAISLLSDIDSKNLFSATSQMLVANGFEDGVSPMSTWSSGGTITQDTTVAYYGEASLKMARTSSNSFSTSKSQVFSIASDSTRIRLSAMIKGDGVPVSTTIYCASSSSSWMYGGQQSAIGYASNEWSEVENIYTCPDDAIAIGIIFSHKGAIDSSLWVDNLKIEEIQYNQNVFLSDLTTKKMELPGVNLSANNASWPENWELDYFASKGMKSIRIPITWELFQDELYGELKEDSTTLEQGDTGLTPWGNPIQYNFPNLDRIIGKAEEVGLKVLLDLHNYDQYGGAYLDSGAPLADIWSKLATRYRNEEHLLFGIMNEPGMLDWNNYNVETWVAHANEAISAIRATGANQPIFVYWLDHLENVSYMLDKILDPIDNYVWEIHAYIDPNGEGGRNSNCMHEYRYIEKLSKTTSMFRSRGEKAYLGEFAAGTIHKLIGDPENMVCYNAIRAAVNYMSFNNDVWLGYAWWTAGSAWRSHYMPGGYMYDMTPILNEVPSPEGLDSNPMKVLEPFL